MKILTTMTGGLDSSYNAFRLLTETTDEVTALYMEPDTSSFSGTKLTSWRDINTCSLIQLPKIIEWLSTNCRPIALECVKEPKRREGEWHMPTILRYAACRCNRGDFDAFDVSRNTDNQRALGTAMLPRYHAWWLRHVGQTPRLTFSLLDTEMGRAHIWVKCPPELRNLSIRCDRPTPMEDGISFTRCGLCVKCKMDIEIVSMLEQGKTEDEIADRHWRVRAAWKYVNLTPDTRFNPVSEGRARDALND